MYRAQRKPLRLAAGFACLTWVAALPPADPQDRPAGKLAPMPVGRAMFVAAAVDGRIYCVGGTDHKAEPIPAVHAYDVAANTWSEKAKWPTPSAYPCGAAAGGKVYVVGGPTGKGRRASAVERYDPKTDAWDRLADLPAPRSHSAAAAVGDAVYVLGGHAPNDPDTGVIVGDLDDVSVLDTRIGRWSAGPKLPKPAHGLSAAVVGGTVHVFGGLATPAEHYALDGGRWQRRADVPFGVVKVCATGVRGKAVVVGGTDSERGVAVYDPAADRWVRGNDSGVRRFLSQVVAVGDAAYALGGIDGRRSQVRVEWYDAAADRWRD